MKRKGAHTKSRYLLIVLTIVCLSLITLTVNQFVSIDGIRNAAGTLIVPLQTGINRVGDWLNSRTDGYISAVRLARENEELRQKVDYLEEQNTILSENADELARLRDLYKLDQDYSAYDKVAASVIAKDPGNWYNTFTINKGTNDGIAVDMNVITTGGLVGLVTKVGTNWAQVRTIIDDNSNVSAMLMTTNANCIISGDLSLINEGKLTLSELRSEIVASPGEKVVTSNISSKYLPGILIGYIDTISDDTNHLTKTGYLIPSVDFEDIRNVFVILKVKETGN